MSSVCEPLLPEDLRQDRITTAFGIDELKEFRPSTIDICQIGTSHFHQWRTFILDIHFMKVINTKSRASKLEEEMSVGCRVLVPL